MQVKILPPIALFPFGFFIQWSLDQASESGDYVFTVYRSGGPLGPWELIRENTNTYGCTDAFTSPVATTTLQEVRPNHLNLFRQFYYRVVAKSPSGSIAENTVDASSGFGDTLHDKKMTQYYRSARRNFALSLQFNGTPCALLKRKRWGVRCRCLDARTKEIVRASCKQCWGTGFIGGYWTPYYSSARQSVSSGTTAITPQNKSDSSDVRVWLPDYPLLERDDLIVFYRENNRWRIDQATSTQIRLQEIHQICSAQLIERGDILYQLPVSTPQMEVIF